MKPPHLGVNIYYEEKTFNTYLWMGPDENIEFDLDAWVIFAGPYMKRDIGYRWIKRKVIYKRVIEYFENYDVTNKPSLKHRLGERKFKKFRIDESVVHGWSNLALRMARETQRKLIWYLPTKNILFANLVGLALSFMFSEGGVVDKNVDSVTKAVSVGVVALAVLIVDFARDVTRQSELIGASTLFWEILLQKNVSNKINIYKSTIKRFRIKYSLSLVVTLLVVFVVALCDQ